MKERYIHEVCRRLALPRAYRAEIARDLREIFADALENGESERQVIERLGAPAEFAASIHEQLGIVRPAKRFHMLPLALIALSAAALALFCFAWAQSVPGAVIGRADALTGILLSRSLPAPHWLFLGLSAIFLLATAITFILCRRGGKEHRL